MTSMRISILHGSFCEGARLLFAILWIYTGFSHATSIEQFSIAILNYRLTTPNTIAFAASIASIHLVLGSLLLLRLHVSLAFGLTSLLLLLYGVVGASALYRGLEISCGCLGTNSPSVSTLHVVANVLLALLSLTTLVLIENERSKRILQRLRSVSTIRRSGATLVELLCVISIVGLLLGIIAPAIQQARESARVVNCKNNLRQLGLALKNHESAFNSLPPGTLGGKSEFVLELSAYPGWATNPSSPWYLHNNQNTSWIVHLLSHLEQVNLADTLPPICTNSQQTYFEHLAVNSALKPRLIDNQTVQVAASQLLPLLICPSAIRQEQQPGDEIEAGSQPAYLTDLAMDHFIYFTSSIPMKSTNYAACSGAGSGVQALSVEMTRYDGAFRNRVGKKLRQVTDGTSNSIALGETLGSIQYGKQKTVNPWFFAMMCRGRSDLNWFSRMPLRYPGLELLGDQMFAHQAGFASNHLATANFCLVDGSVQSIHRDVDLLTFYQLCGISDGEVLSDWAD